MRHYTSLIVIDLGDDASEVCSILYGRRGGHRARFHCGATERVWRCLAR
jgi:hypothetical protein